MLSVASDFRGHTKLVSSMIADIPDNAPEVGIEGWQADRNGFAFAYTDTTGGMTDTCNMSVLPCDVLDALHVISTVKHEGLAQYENVIAFAACRPSQAYCG